MRYDGIQSAGSHKTNAATDIRKKKLEEDQQNSNNNYMTNFINNVGNLLNGTMKVDQSDASSSYRADNGQGGTIA